MFESAKKSSLLIGLSLWHYSIPQLSGESRDRFQPLAGASRRIGDVPDSTVSCLHVRDLGSQPGGTGAAMDALPWLVVSTALESHLAIAFNVSRGGVTMNHVIIGVIMVYILLLVCPWF
jgi:hypothetical protein